MGAKEVAILREGTEVRRPIGELAVGDLFVVRPGEKVATDGVVVEGASAVERPARPPTDADWAAATNVTRRIAAGPDGA
jgi:hypothetical protein